MAPSHRAFRLPAFAAAIAVLISTNVAMDVRPLDLTGRDQWFAVIGRNFIESLGPSYAFGTVENGYLEEESDGRLYYHADVIYSGQMEGVMRGSIVLDHRPNIPTRIYRVRGTPYFIANNRFLPQEYKYVDPEGIDWLRDAVKDFLIARTLVASFCNLQYASWKFHAENEIRIFAIFSFVHKEDGPSTGDLYLIRKEGLTIDGRLKVSEIFFRDELKKRSWHC